MKVVVTKQFEESLRYITGEPESFAEFIRFSFRRVSEIPGNIHRWCRHAWQRVFNHGLDDTMTFSMDHTLAEIIERMLIQYKNHAKTTIEMGNKDVEYIDQCIQAFKDYQNFDFLSPLTNKEQKLLDKDPKAFTDLKNDQYKDILRRMRKLFTKPYAGLWW